MVSIVLVCALAGGQDAASKITLRVHTSAIRKLLMEQVFKEEGRYYFSASLLCPRAYFENPRPTINGGRLKVVAHGVACGLEGDVTVSGIPFARGKQLGLRDIRIDEGGVLGQALLSLVGGKPELFHDFREEVDRWARQSGNSLAWMVGGPTIGPPRLGQDTLSLDVTAVLEVR
jgi:hypothetical protein